MAGPQPSLMQSYLRQAQDAFDGEDDTIFKIFMVVLSIACTVMIVAAVYYMAVVTVGYLSGKIGSRRYYKREGRRSTEDTASSSSGSYSDGSEGRGQRSSKYTSYSDDQGSGQTREEKVKSSTDTCHKNPSSNSLKKKATEVSKAASKLREKSKKKVVPDVCTDAASGSTDIFSVPDSVGSG